MKAGQNIGVAAPGRPNIIRFVRIALLAPLLLLIFSAWLVHEYQVTEALRREARAAYDYQTAAATLIGRITDAESSMRGYVITGNPAFLDTYRPARTSAVLALQQMRADLGDDAAQQKHLRELRDLAMRKFAQIDQVIDERRTKGFAAAAGIIDSGEGKMLMDRIRPISATMFHTSQVTLRDRVSNYRRRFFVDAISVWVGFAYIGVLLVVTALVVWRQRLSQYRAQMEAYSVAERNRSILESTIDAIVIFSPIGTIETVNTAATVMFGYDAEELVGRDVAVVIPMLDGLTTFHERIGLVNGNLANPHLPNRKVMHRDRHEIPVDIALGVMHLPDGDYIVASIRDISERKRAERMKDELISTVSHELRTPLTSVVGALGLLRSGAAGEIAAGPARLIEIAENNSRRLIRLINDMLDIDRIQSGQLTLARQRIDLRTVADQACEGSQGAAASAHVSVLCDLPDVPVLVSGDADRLLQVISNLVSNAIRVTDAGGAVVIGVAADEAGSRARVTVDDDGPGVPLEFRDRIFGRFERAAREQGVGTGLGLAISREIVSRHDGQIWFEDRPGGGTRFVFTVDVLHDTVPAAEAMLRPKVLVCEQDEHIAPMLRSIVDASGFDMVKVGTAAAARAALATGTYAAVLIDLHLPDDSGLSVAKGLSRADGSALLPIIIVSAEARDGIADSIPCDIVDWIDKPVDPDRLDAAIRAAMARSGAGQELPTILHLDDDLDVLDVTESALRFEAQVFKATTLDAARALLETETFDLAILDLHLSGDSGLELLPMLIDQDGLAIPTIIFSAQDVSADAAAKVDAVLVKSRGSMPDLKKTIRRVLDKTRAGTRGQS